MGRHRVTAGQRQEEHRADEGATMLLALIFLVVMSLVIIGVERWTGNNLANTSKFVSAQSLQSEANSANDLAIQFVRYTFMNTSLDGQAPAPCWNTVSSTASQYPPSGDTFPGPTVLPVDAWCMTRFYPANSEREVTVSTCKSTVSAATCEGHPLLQTIVTITDNLSGCAPLPLNSTVSDTTCGTHMKISDWQFGAVPPIVSSVTTSTGGWCAGMSGSPTPVVVTGLHLDLATDIDFIVPGSASTTSPVLASGTVVSSTDSSVDACATTDLSAPLDVVVSTPMGSSGYSTQWLG
jgi:hypothetical protein